MNSDLTLIEKEANLHDKKKSAWLIVNDNQILDKGNIDGISMNFKNENDILEMKIIVKENTKPENPIHVCFGAIHGKIKQNIKLEIILEKNSSANFFSHCILTSKEKIIHNMTATIIIKENAKYSYVEKHIHSDSGNINIDAKTKLIAEKNSRIRIDYSLVKGRFGNSEFFYDISAGKDSKVEMESKMSLSKDDVGMLDEIVSLDGKNSSAVVKSRVAVRNDSVMKVKNRITANCENSVGHIDCSEILLDNGRTLAYPEAIVNHPKARITHEASLGGIDNKKMESLMARGLSEEEAEDLILEGILE